ncbi:putative MFS-type transporter YxiO [Desulfosarcina alkanivorans]|uniref:Putative MFS-type transporter YxiO n=1 Tax=Desulfosarcina alkanivorans TaxID=571177 RepID=A0A5K7YUF2_9BACT|nr:MFS transporter [Desulfosarcina alkanivorans]BBO68317.1 putative MFS-type transporter YxiO [Desulfosarcina alkanivorans]
MKPRKKAVWGWAMYDWANSAFATTVMSGFFPVFFKQYWSAGVDVNLSTARLGLGNAAAGLLVALAAPILGAVADRGSARKRFLALFAYLGVLTTAGLYFVGQGNWAFALVVYAMGVIGFSGANVFYDALLPEVAGEKDVDVVSGFGFSMGYLGGGLLFLVNVLMVTMPQRFGLADAGQAVRVGFLSVALWWGFFTLFVLFWVPEKPASGTRAAGAWSGGFAQLKHTFGRIRHMKTVLLFLCAYWLYIDGVDTIIRMAVDFGMSLGFDAKDLLLALLVTQFVGFPAALVFGRLGQRIGPRKGIYIAIGVYVAATFWGISMTRKEEFYVLAAVIGLVQGGIQALSRSYYSRLIPADKPAEFYGFYNMLGKFAAIIGPVLVGGVGLLMRRLLMPPDPTAADLVHVGALAARWSMASVLILFAAGAVLLYFVDEEKGKAQAAML